MMSTSCLTIDLGNSRLKACVFEGERPEPSRQIDLATDDEFVTQLARWLEASRLPQRALVCSVAWLEAEDQVRDYLAAKLGLDAVATPDSGLKLDVRQPETVGADRLFAARAALELTGKPCLVVDAGTALTVDAVRPLNDDAASGEFMGGAIAAGPQLLAAALERGAARLPRIDPKPHAPALGKDTRAAIESGVVVGFRGACLELCRCVQAEAQLDEAEVILTGGAREFVSGHLPRARIEPQLVHLGLLFAGGARASVRG